METSVNIIIRGFENTTSIEDRLRRNVEKLPLFHQRIESCKIAVDMPQKHKHQGKLFNVRIDVNVPKKHLVVNRTLNENLYVAIREAFSAMKRQLERYNRQQKNNVKVHPERLTGTITRLYKDYGFIESSDGREFYFNASSVMHPAFDHIEIGGPVQFIESMMDDGLQAVHINAQPAE